MKVHLSIKEVLNICNLPAKALYEILFIINKDYTLEVSIYRVKHSGKHNNIETCCAFISNRMQRTTLQLSVVQTGNSYFGASASSIIASLCKYVVSFK